MTPELWVCQLGTVEYREALALQERVRAARQAGVVPDVMLVLEHWPVYTRGRRSGPGELPMGEDWYRAQGIEIVDVDRGGKVTYHGPGQLVGYPIVAVDDVVEYVRTLERGIVAALRRGGRRRRAGAARGRPRLHRRLGGRAQDRLDRGARRARRDHARVGGQRRERPAAVLVGGAVRARRRPDDLADRGDRPRPPGQMPCFRKRAAYRGGPRAGRRQRLVSLAAAARRRVGDVLTPA